VPPTINSLETVQAKKDMLAVLADIELAQQLKEKAKNKAKKQAVSGCTGFVWYSGFDLALQKSKVVEQDHPDDLHYEGLGCDLEHMSAGKELKVGEGLVAGLLVLWEDSIFGLFLGHHGLHEQYHEQRLAQVQADG
jgi:hypothetical protein